MKHHSGHVLVFYIFIYEVVTAVLLETEFVLVF